MRFSTSSFEALSAERAFWLLLTLLALYGSALEVASRLGFVRCSHIQTRIDCSRREALAMRPDRHHVLVVGNSLLLHSVQTERLQRELGASYPLTCYAVENTAFLDWYFGLRRLFAEGARPTTVAICLRPHDFLTDHVRDEYFGRYLMDSADLWQARTAAALDNNQTMELVFASVSSWMGSRGEIRNWLLNEIEPDMDELAGRFVGPATHRAEGDEVERCCQRLGELQRLCSEHSARLLWIVANSPHDADLEGRVVSRARSRCGVLWPLPADRLPAAAYFDGLHMTPSAAALFTERLAPLLRASLSPPAAGAAPPPAVRAPRPARPPSISSLSSSS
jgi:hypothetical protein